MTQEEKDLLLKDLCARLPYGVICNCVDPKFSGSVDWTLYSINLQDGTIETTNDVWNDEFAIENIKPYLRPMESMTEEEKAKLNNMCDVVYSFGMKIYSKTPEFYDELNANHFDYRGLIPMGLALPASEGMYNN